MSLSAGICLKAESQCAGQDEHQASSSSNVPVPGSPAVKSMQTVVPVALRGTQEEGWVIPDKHTEGICAALGVVACRESCETQLVFTTWDQLRPTICSQLAAPNLSSISRVSFSRFLSFSPCFVWIGQMVFVVLLFIGACGFVLRSDLITYPLNIPRHTD